MLKEAPKILRALLGHQSGKRILNLGSATEDFYKVEQPFIWEEWLLPLKKDNEVINCDAKNGAGVDVVAEAAKLPFGDGEFDVVLCTSLLEHVEDVGAVVSEIKRVLKRPGVLLAEVPSDYPYHPDPIDTMFRIFTKDEWGKVLDGFFVQEFADIAGKATAVRATIW